MNIDIHVHTTASFCSEFTPGELVHLARELKVPAVVTTNHHDVIGDVDYLRRELAGYGIPYFPGVEISNQWGDFLLFGEYLEDFETPRREFPVDLLPRQDIAVVWAHPFRSFGAHEIEIIRLQVMGYIDAIEGINGNCIRYDCPEANDLAREMAFEMRKPAVAGSDSHSPWSYYTIYTEFLEPVHSYKDFVRCFKTGKVRIPETETGEQEGAPESGMTQ